MTGWSWIRRPGDSVVPPRPLELYAPYGEVPDPIVPWVFLYSVFGLALVGWQSRLLGHGAGPGGRGGIYGLLTWAARY